jgi:hypothetical protein
VVEIGAQGDRFPGVHGMFRVWVTAGVVRVVTEAESVSEPRGVDVDDCDDGVRIVWENGGADSTRMAETVTSARGGRPAVRAGAGIFHVTVRGTGRGHVGA